MDIRAVIFDIDGTLVNVEERFFKYFNVTLANFGIQPLDRAVYEAKRLDGTLSDPILDVGEIRAKFWLDFIDLFSYCDSGEIGRLFPGVPETLDVLKTGGYKMAIVTGRTCAFQRVVEELRTLGINQYFDCILTNDDGIKGMNKAAKLIACARNLGVSPAECVYIGDWEGDVRSAKEANIGMVVAVLTGGESREALARTDPDFILESVADVPELLRKYPLSRNPSSTSRKKIG